MTTYCLFFAFMFFRMIIFTIKAHRLNKNGNPSISVNGGMELKQISQ